MYEWVCVCVSVSHRNPTPDDPWDWENLQTSCVLQITCRFLCYILLDPWCCVQNYQLFLWLSGLITSHSRLCLVVFWVRFPIASLLHISNLTLKPCSSLAVFLSYCHRGVFSPVLRAGTSSVDLFCFKLICRLIFVEIGISNFSKPTGDVFKVCDWSD